MAGSPKRKRSPAYKKVKRTSPKHRDTARLSARYAYDNKIVRVGESRHIPQPNGTRKVKCLLMRVNGSPYWGKC